MAFLIHIHPGPHGPARTESFVHSPVRIGRNPLNDLVLADPMVSQIHGVFRFGPGEVSYVDVGSSNGSLVNGARVAQNQPVALTGAGTDRVQVGSLVLSPAEVNVPPSTPPARRTSQFDERRFGAATLFFGKGGLPVEPTVAMSARPSGEGGAEAELAAALAKLAPALEAHRSATASLVRSVEAMLQGASEAQKATLLERLVHTTPSIAHEPAVEELLERLGIDIPGVTPLAAQRFLHLLVEGSASTAPTRGVPGARRALERIGAVLETQSDAFVELRRAYRHFAEELGVMTVDAQGSLPHSMDRVALHRHVFDWAADGNERVDELKRAYADLALHQVALLQGVIAGIRALLSELSPDALASPGGALAPRGGGSIGWLGRLLPFGRSRLWNRYVAQHRAFVEEDRFTRTVFGSAFARAYFAVTGGNASSGRG